MKSHGLPPVFLLQVPLPGEIRRAQKVSILLNPYGIPVYGEMVSAGSLFAGEPVLAGTRMASVPHNPRCLRNEAANTYQLPHAEICDLCARKLTLASLRTRLPAELDFDFELLADDPECLEMWNTVGYLFDVYGQPVEVGLFYTTEPELGLPNTASLESRALPDGRTATAYLVMHFILETFRS